MERVEVLKVVEERIAVAEEGEEGLEELDQDLDIMVLVAELAEEAAR